MRALGITLLVTVLPVLASAATYTDDFTQGSTVALSAHTATPSSGTWTKQEGGAADLTDSSADFVIGGNNDNAKVTYTVSWTPAGPEYTVSMKIVQESTGGTPADDYKCLIGRFTDASNYYYACFLRGSDSPDTYLGKREGGVNTVLVSGDCGHAVNDTVTLRLLNSAKSVELNGSQCASMTSADNNLTSAGNGGIGCGTIAVAGGDCSSTFQIDNFALADIVSSGASRGLLLGVYP